MSRIDKKRLVVTQANRLALASYSLSLEEKRLIMFLTSLVRKDDKDFQIYRIPISEIKVFFKVTGKDFYARLRKIAKNLRSRPLSIEKPNGGWIELGWIYKAEYRPKWENGLEHACLDLRFDPDLKPYLLDLNERFFSYLLSNITDLKSVYSIRLYEIFMSYRRIWKTIFELEDLKMRLQIEGKYKNRYGDFKRKVLEVAKKELEEKTDIYFLYSEKRIWKSVKTIHFKIFARKKDIIKSHPPENSNQTNKDFINTNKTLYSKLINQGVQPSQITSFLNNPGIWEHGIKMGFDYFKKRHDSGKIHTNKLAYLIGSISGKWRFEKQEHEHEKQKKIFESRKNMGRWKEIVKNKKQQKHLSELKKLEENIELFFKDSNSQDYKQWKNVVWHDIIKTIKKEYKEELYLKFKESGKTIQKEITDSVSTHNKTFIIEKFWSFQTDNNIFKASLISYLKTKWEYDIKKFCIDKWYYDNLF